MSEPDRLFTDGKAYERLMGRWSRGVGDVFLDWLDIPTGLRWLDVGCGTGAFTEALIARSAPAAVMAIDPAEAQIAYARQRPGATLAEFRLGDAQALPFADASFDVAAMALVIAFVPDPAKAVAEMVRVVRPGGRIATYMWDFLSGGAPNEPIYAAFKSLGMAPPMPPGAAAARREALREIWEMAGLAAVETRVIRIPIAYAGFDDYWASSSAPAGPLGKAIGALSPSAKEQLRTRVREQVPIAADGRIAYEAFANAVKGRVPG